jgi:pyruvate,orthophosphate dikinase
VLAKNEKERRKALDKLLPLQVNDFKKLFEVANGKPIIVRLLDPPLHEFLPNPLQLLEEIHKLEQLGEQEKARKKRELYEKVKRMQEANPMIGFRMCRIGIVFPEIYETQTKAIVKAKEEVEKKGIKVNVKIMIPGVIEKNELKLLRERITDEVGGSKIEIGTMIETPRSALTADEIAEVADFFSFGTNDLTQTTMAMSRDDAQSFLLVYLDKKILPEDPFKVLDKEGVGKLIKIGIELGRKKKPNIEIGVCGEHGGDPESIMFFNEVGVDYVSCSPFRVPIARLSAAQAEIKRRKKS